MADYGQFCPVAKATELVGERWTLLILRELLLGSHRFSDFQRALSKNIPVVVNQAIETARTSRGFGAQEAARRPSL